MRIQAAFIDHHLNNFHADKFLTLLREPLAAEGVDVTSAWESNPAGDDWCAKNGVRRASSIEDAVRSADAVFLLAPDNIEDHAALAAAVLPFGKPTLIDKFLAPTLAEAREIVALARKHSTPLFSSSSLRYAVELEEAVGEISGSGLEAAECYARGMGRWEGYGIHTLSLAMRLMGHRVLRVINTGTSRAAVVTLDYGDDRRASLDVRTAEREYELFPWRFGARIGDRYVVGEVRDFDGFYANLMRRTAAFFRSGQADMPLEEALTCVAVLEAAAASRDEWVRIPDLT